MTLIHGRKIANGATNCPSMWTENNIYVPCKGHLRDCNNVRKVYRYSILLMLYDYTVGLRTGGFSIRP